MSLTADASGKRRILFNRMGRRPRSYKVLWPMVLAALLFSRHLTGSLYGDEVGHTFHVVVLGDLWKNLLDPSMCHPPLFFVLAKAAYWLAGTLWAMRLPSFLAALGTVLVMAFGAKRFLGSGFMLPAAWLAACSPFVMEFAGEARAYSLMIFFATATLFAFMGFMEAETWKGALILVLVASLGGLTHFFFWILLLYLALAYLVIRRKLTGKAAFVGAATAVALVPFGILTFVVQHLAFKGYLQVAWAKSYLEPFNFMARLPVAMWLGYCTFKLPQLDPGRNVGLSALKSNAPLVALLALFFCGVAFGCFALVRKGQRWFWFLAGAVAVPCLIGLGASMAGLYLIREKHLAIVWAPLFLLTLMAFGQLKAHRWGWVPIGAYIMLVAVSIAHFAFQPNLYSRRMDWAGLRAALEKQVQQGDTLVLYQYEFETHSPDGPALNVSGARRVDFSALVRRAGSAPAAIRELEKSAPNRIYLVDDETDRLSVDPGNQLIQTLREGRTVRLMMFGRNLVLYEFGPRQEDGGEAP